MTILTRTHPVPIVNCEGPLSQQQRDSLKTTCANDIHAISLKSDLSQYFGEKYEEVMQLVNEAAPGLPTVILGHIAEYSFPDELAADFGDLTSELDMCSCVGTNITVVALTKGVPPYLQSPTRILCSECMKYRTVTVRPIISFKSEQHKFCPIRVISNVDLEFDKDPPFLVCVPTFPPIVIFLGTGCKSPNHNAPQRLEFTFISYAVCRSGCSQDIKSTHFA